MSSETRPANPGPRLSATGLNTTKRNRPDFQEVIGKLLYSLLED